MTERPAMVFAVSPNEVWLYGPDFEGHWQEVQVLAWHGGKATVIALAEGSLALHEPACVGLGQLKRQAVR